MTKHLVLYSDSSHKHILTWHTENDDFQVKQVIQTSFPKGVTFKNRKKSQRIMNFSLHLQTIFTFIRQNKATSEEKKQQPIHIYKNWTRRLLVMYLNSTTVDLFWLKGVLETVHAHIHIYIYQGPWSCQMLQTLAFCLFTWLYFFSPV